MTVLFNEGEFALDVPVYYGLSSNFRCVASGDLDGDGRLGLAVTNGSRVAVFLNHCGGVFGAEVLYEAGQFAIWVALGDLDGDGDLDLAVADSDGPCKCC